MTADGAQGTTADEMKTVLYPDVALTDIQAATNWLEQGVKDSAQPMETRRRRRKAGSTQPR